MMAGVDLEKTRSTAVVMNLFYTGLGIARSLGERGVPVIGLSAEAGVYGNFSRYARTVLCADSLREPEQLLAQLIELGQKLGHRAVLFPTRDHDLVFIDRFRSALEPYFTPVAPSASALERCLDKWETYNWAQRAGVPTPRCWQVDSTAALRAVIGEVTFPCVLKPVAAYHWRSANRWEVVGARKAISVSSPEELLREYAVIAAACQTILLQEQVPGADDCLVVAACYMDRKSKFLGGFNAQKLVQTPPGFGTGCIVQSAHRPELFDRTIRLLQTIEFSGIAEVEYKWDATISEYQLIEINPRPWDQHRLGAACGVDLMYLAYCDLAGLPIPKVHARVAQRKWIAEDAFLLTALRIVWRRESGLATLFRQARGSKIYAIWSARDPLPFLAYIARLVPSLIRMGLRAVRERISRVMEGRGKPAMPTVR
jgi:predicted ATP-grasp superfamily ATP-dependent carboligase